MYTIDQLMATLVRVLNLIIQAARVGVDQQVE
jgi:hypothetical protein